ncbi:MAG: AAA family ATPase [Ruminococcaceae bacterium]|nr:AAA family ATPase [Oscillospiraceae bacterium]
MLKTKRESRIDEILFYLPSGLGEEIRRLARTRRGGAADIREIRIRAHSRSSVSFSDECITLFSTVDKGQMLGIVEKLIDGALYAHRDSIASGYVSIGGGVRVGICGQARYEGERLVGVGNISSLLFRIPSGECAFADELYSAYVDGTVRGMLIYSPPGLGKTTALRSLAGSLGTGKEARRVAVIDERCEFDESDYPFAEVDILKGYKRSEGIEIATRTMSPEVIMIDEIGEGDAEPISRVLRCGIPIIATAHAGSLEELRARVALLPLFSLGAFDCFVGISREGGEYRLQIDRTDAVS